MSHRPSKDQPTNPRRTPGGAGNPYAALVSAGLFVSDQNYWNAELPKLQAAADTAPDPETEVRIGWGLRYTYHLRAAEERFRGVIETAPDTPGADFGYFMTLKDMDRAKDALDFGRNTWPESENRGFCYGVSELLLSLGNVEQARVLQDEWLFLGEQMGEVWDLRGRLAASLGNWDEAAQCFIFLVNKGVHVPRVLVQFLGTLAKANAAADIDGVERAAAEALQGPLPMPTWSRYQLARWCPVGDVRTQFASEPETDVVLPPVSDYTTVHSRWNLNLVDGGDAGATLKAPVVTADGLKANIAKFQNVVRALIDNGHFRMWSDNIAAFDAAFAGPKRWPVFVLSTGRCGTLGLQNLLERSRRVLGYHTVTMYPSSVDRNHLLYRILEGRFDSDVVAELLSIYLETRATEWMYALRRDRSPVIVHHLDTVFAPFNAVFFRESRFLHLHRDPAATCRSLLTKNQWGQQLQHWLYDPAFPDGRFVHRRDDGLSIDRHVAWYLYLTRTFAGALGEIVGSERFSSVRSEDLFARKPEAYQALRKVLPIYDVSEDDYRSHYARKINDKIPLIDPDVGDLTGVVDGLGRALDSLDRTGTVE